MKQKEIYINAKKATLNANVHHPVNHGAARNLSEEFERAYLEQSFRLNEINRRGKYELEKSNINGLNNINPRSLF